MSGGVGRRIARLECFAGISGDMLMGALIDAGAPVDALESVVAGLGLSAALRISKVDRSGIQAAKADVLVAESAAGKSAESAAETHSHAHDHSSPNSAPAHHHRNLSSIRAILAAAPLSERARSLSLRAFECLAEAEAKVHGIAIDKVHFHEVGAVDAIVDIVVCAVAADLLRVERWYASAINVGSGFVDCAHGRFPVPAPATAALLRQAPVYSAGPAVEMTTPTGAALLRALDCRFEEPGILRAETIGYGAGSRNPERFPNVLRLTIGELAASGPTGGGPGFAEEIVTVMECAIDDMNPQALAYAAQLALERGALDVMTSPVTMKKGRLGALLTVLCRPAEAGALEEMLFRETSTLGIRVREEKRLALARESMKAPTEFGEIRMKVGLWHGEEVNAAPEFEDCRRAAEASGAPLKTVMQAAMAEWRRRRLARSGGGEQ